ncbi:hypothetical protein KC345_g8872 [Hortaea werneckii]|nr:hypothetical protein KC345_g8872 [Hortaea werneckii]
MDKSPLSKLAAEIRNEIYELVLCPSDGIHIGLVEGTVAAVKLAHPPPEQKICSLLATCKAIRKECRSMFYETNVFQIDEPSVSTKTSQNDEENVVRMKRYAESVRMLQNVVPPIRKIRIDVGALRCENAHASCDDSQSLAKRCYALRETITMIPTMPSVDLQGLLRTYDCSRGDCCVFPKQDPAAAAAAAVGTTADHVSPVTFLFNLR